MNTESIESAYKMLAGMDLTIEDSTKFIDYVKKNGKGLNETVNEIKVAKEKSSKKIDYSDFEKKLVDSFKKIQNTINKDGLFQYSHTKYIDKFRKFFQEIVDNYVIILKLKDDKDEAARKKKELDQLKSKMRTIISNTSIMPSDDIEKMNELNFKLGVKNIEYKKVLELIEEDVQVITRNSVKINFINLLDDLIYDLNSLTEILSKLSLNPSTRQNVEEMVLELKNNLINRKNEYENDINYFKELCTIAGIVGESLEKDDVVIYNGSKPLYGADYTNLLQEGKEYRIIRTIINGNGNEEFYIEGFDKPLSVTLFDTKMEWKQKQKTRGDDLKFNVVSKTEIKDPEFKFDIEQEDELNNLEEYMPRRKDKNEEYLVTQVSNNSQDKPVNKVEAYVNSVASLTNKKVQYSFRKTISNLLAQFKEKINNIRLDLEEEYLDDYVLENSTLLQDESIDIDQNEFKKSFEQMKQDEDIKKR